jgi:hypothetical protein
MSPRSPSVTPPPAFDPLSGQGIIKARKEDRQEG